MSLIHKWGGNILAIQSVNHETDRGVADWFFRCTVHWPDSGRETDCMVGPNQLCHDNTEAGVTAHKEAHELLSAYLRTRGDWHESKRARDGRIYLWTPHEKHGSATLDELRSCAAKGGAA